MTICGAMEKTLVMEVVPVYTLEIHAVAIPIVTMHAMKQKTIAFDPQAPHAVMASFATEPVCILMKIITFNTPLKLFRILNSFTIILSTQF